MGLALERMQQATARDLATISRGMGTVGREAMEPLRPAWGVRRVFMEAARPTTQQLPTARYIPCSSDKPHHGCVSMLGYPHSALAVARRQMIC